MHVIYIKGKNDRVTKCPSIVKNFMGVYIINRYENNMIIYITYIDMQNTYFGGNCERCTHPITTETVQWGYIPYSIVYLYTHIYSYVYTIYTQFSNTFFLLLHTSTTVYVSHVRTQ